MPNSAKALPGLLDLLPSTPYHCQDMTEDNKFIFIHVSRNNLSGIRFNGLEESTNHSTDQ